MKSSMRATAAAIAAAALLGTSGAVLAQHGPMHHHRHHGGGFGDVAMYIAAVKGQLNLNTSQQQMWDNAVAASKAARETGRANFGRLHDAAAAELAKAEPDLASLAAVSDDVQGRNQALRRQVRDAWLALYATFTPDQKAVVRDALKSRMARAERMREKFRERHSR
jgi:Spy/CpxP family protein refolding chaperone